MGCINSRKVLKEKSLHTLRTTPTQTSFQNSISREEMAKIHAKRIKKSNKYAATISNHYKREDLKRKQTQQSQKDKRQDEIVANWMT